MLVIEYSTTMDYSRDSDGMVSHNKRKFYGETQAQQKWS